MAVKVPLRRESERPQLHSGESSGASELSLLRTPTLWINIDQSYGTLFYCTKEAKELEQCTRRYWCFNFFIICLHFFQNSPYKQSIDLFPCVQNSHFNDKYK